LVDNLLDYTPADVEYTVFCTAKKYEKKLESYKGARLIYLDRDANGKDSILYDYESMKIAVREKVQVRRLSPPPVRFLLRQGQRQPTGGSVLQIIWYWISMFLES
ncbi:MAG: hypothetical protein IIU15_08660, partial [Treponema sp.]|nr:hypothetical protein [Treponema sp.]